MKIEEILVIMQNKLAVLAEARKAASATGDLLKVMNIDEEIMNTHISIEKLKTVL